MDKFDIYEIIPMRDSLEGKGTFADSTETQFIECEDKDATLWEVVALVNIKEDGTRNYEFVDDFESRADAEAFINNKQENYEYDEDIILTPEEVRDFCFKKFSAEIAMKEYKKRHKYSALDFALGSILGFCNEFVKNEKFQSYVCKEFVVFDEKENRYWSDKEVNDFETQLNYEAYDNWVVVSEGYNNP
jgi:hypothetical protein